MADPTARTPQTRDAFIATLKEEGYDGAELDKWVAVYDKAVRRDLDKQTGYTARDDVNSAVDTAVGTVSKGIGALKDAAYAGGTAVAGAAKAAKDKVEDLIDGEPDTDEKPVLGEVVAETGDINEIRDMRGQATAKMMAKDKEWDEKSKDLAANTRKSYDDMLRETVSETMPKKESESSESAPKNPANLTPGEVIEDDGGYKYQYMPSGDFMILESPRGGAGKIVRSTSKYYDAIYQRAAERSKYKDK